MYKYIHDNSNQNNNKLLSLKGQSTAKKYYKLDYI